MSPRPRKVKPSEKLEKAQEVANTKMREVDSYTHDGKTRVNIPPVGMAQYDTAEEPLKTYEYDPHIDPSLQWAGKAERTSFEVPTSSIHIHESVKPLKIISSLLNKYQSTEYTKGQTTLWHEESPAERMKRRRESIEFYQHGVDWTNRMIAGDSLVIMNSLLEREGMAGQVQMVYFDPPYGIKYGSNFQPFVNKKKVGPTDPDDDLSQEPEMIKAFRDTWELGTHSYLSYLRDRILLAKDLLSETGSLFIQISDDNEPHVREICNEIFGADNFVANITYRTKKMTMGNSRLLETIGDHIIWYARSKDKVKFHPLYQKKDWRGDLHWSYIELPDGTRRTMTAEEKHDASLIPSGSKVFIPLDLRPSGYFQTGDFEYEFEGKIYHPGTGKSWRTNRAGMDTLKDKNRLYATSTALTYVLYFDDYPMSRITNFWTDTEGAYGATYVVQTSTKIIQRCMLMTTDPGDLVLDITCGSGTTAFVAEQWGRRWITCDTSRVALALAKQRLMTATFDYYQLAHPEQGIDSGFVYKTAPHITLKSIANNEPPATETLYDQPEIEKDKIRVSGPFTIEALPAPVVKPIENVVYEENAGKKQEDWIDQLAASGILGRGGNRIYFSRVEPLSGTRFVHAEAETKEDNPQRAVICFGSETKPLDSRMVSLALNEIEDMRPTPKLLIFAAFQFDPEASKDIDETKWPGLTLLKVQMNTDLMTKDLKKKERSAQSFLLIGQPDVELLELGEGKYKVKVNGFDYYNVRTGIVESGDTSRIAMWMLDTNYDGMALEPEQVFFPIGGKNGGWKKLADTLKAEINQDLIEAYAGTESLEFTVKENTQIAVKIIDDRGVESMKVIRIEV